MTGGRLRIVRLANFVMPRSGGLHTALRGLGEGYLAAGHEPVLVVPGETAGDEQTSHGRVITVPGPVLPGTGGYRVLAGRRRLTQLLERLRPDRLEVSDRSTLRWTGEWARRAGVPAMMVSHESLAGLLAVWGLPATLSDRIAGRLNARTAATYDRVVCTTSWAAEEFRRIGATNVVEVPLGVDLELFHPDRHDAALRAQFARPDQALIVHCGRLSAEKRPELAVQTLAALHRDGVPAVLVAVGDGPRRRAVAAAAAGLPVHLVGFIPDRFRVAALLATADVVLAPGPVETFGLAGLEAMASGTPVVVHAASALPQVVGPPELGAGLAAPGDPSAFADAVRRLLARPEQARRAAARARAERYNWPAAVAGFLRAHDAPTEVTRAGGARYTAGATTTSPA
jgi:alpha-1,6-mannosyltransferase